MPTKLPLNPKKKRPGRQVAALPLRVQDGETMVLLVTTRGTGRWMVPKGWAEVGVAPHDLAAKEAFEEAGLVGDVSPEAVGDFTYEKHLDNGQKVLCKVGVYPLWVTQQLENWPERQQRETRWFTLADAARMVDESDLVSLLLSLTAPERR
ncbi:NUDIX hydrolase [Roseomonas sp. 18066]|uniref:NUDIX hydrolase n=1 Tax=Roseomonas sp. 18066 TaxID=2681412 RepID=UPI0013589953|nr:NUDIX hydrolase [Roseomonas sp. 18066]